MYFRNYFRTFLFLFTIMFCTDVCASINGTVTDTVGEPVSGAFIKFTDESNPENEFSAYTDSNGEYEITFLTSVEEDENTAPQAFTLQQNYPNPFNPATTIPFVLNKDGFVELTIYNIMGQKIQKLVRNNLSSGYHTVTWDGRNDSGNGVGAGIYLYQLKSGGHAETKKMLLLDGGSQTGSSQSVSFGNVVGRGNPIFKIATTTYTVTIIGGGTVDYKQTGLVVVDGETYDFVVSRLTSREAYELIIDFTIAKQIMIYDNINIMSNGYTTGLLENDLTYTQIDELFSNIYGLTIYEADIDNALAAINNSQSGSLGKAANIMKATGLISSMKNFFTWATGSGKRSRNRILTVASNIDEQGRTHLYENLRSDWKAKAKNENDFWQKLQNGEFDNQASQIFNDFYHDSDSDFGAMSVDRSLTIQKIVAREGAEGVKAGGELMIDIATTVAPSTKRGVELIQKMDEYSKWLKNTFSDPIQDVKDNAKNAIADRIGSYTDIDGPVDGNVIGNNTAAAIKGVSDFTLGIEDLSEIVGKGLEWGIARIINFEKSEKNSDIAIAQSTSDTVIPNTIISYASTTENISILVPQGSWDVVVISPTGESEKIEDMHITVGEIVVAETQETINFAKSFAGNWNTNWGEMSLSVSGTTVTGTYTWDNGRINASLSEDGTQMVGTWAEAPTYSGSHDAGRITFILSDDGKHFSGVWGYGNAVPTSSWTGTKVE